MTALAELGLRPQPGSALAVPDRLLPARPSRQIAAGSAVGRPIGRKIRALSTGVRPDPVLAPPDPALADRIAPHDCLRSAILPWRRIGGTVVILTDRPERAVRERRRLETLYGPIRFARCDESAFRAAVVSTGGAELVSRSESRVPIEQSCRGFTAPRRAVWVLAVLALVGATLTVTAPWVLFAVLTGWVLAFFALTTALKAAAFAVTIRQGPKPAAVLPQGPLDPASLPIFSLLVPLYREREIASHLLRRLEALDYPPERLDLCLILEEDDALTRHALERAALPPQAQVITVPKGTLKTKPRAMNYALDFARGSIVGIYDAEDKPAPDQLRQVVAHFQSAAPETACLQGVLDYYNCRDGWMARCFTLEYAGWFRILLPGLVRMGLVVPLGGTTLFLRRDVLEALGGWDAHNVTEDADLGVRLARAGYRTELIATVTEEEANTHPWFWIRQRSRWLKGYAATWAVHSRHPRALLFDLGLRRAAGFHVLFLGTLTQFLLAPLLWSLWGVAWVLPTGLAEGLDWPAVWALTGLLVTGWIVDLAVAFAGARAAGKPWMAVWAPTMVGYFPLATVAAWKGLFELAARPFYWDKTSHGHSLRTRDPHAA